MTIIPQCFGCRHLRNGRPMRCDAYPDAPIPTPILLNEADHRKPFEGDHGIRFEPLPAPPTAKG